MAPPLIQTPRQMIQHVEPQDDVLDVTPRARQLGYRRLKHHSTTPIADRTRQQRSRTLGAVRHKEDVAHLSIEKMSEHRQRAYP